MEPFSKHLVSGGMEARGLRIYEPGARRSDTTEWVFGYYRVGLMGHFSRGLTGAALAAAVGVGAWPGLPAASTTASISTTPTVVPGSLATLKGQAFPPSDRVVIDLDGRPLADATTTTTGQLAKRVAIPARWQAGVSAITVSDASGALASTSVTIETTWSQPGGSALASGFDATESVIDAATVDRLGAEWTAPIAGTPQGGVAIGDGFAFVATGDGHLVATSRACRADGGTCVPAWTATTAPTIGASPSVQAGVVYIGASDHILRAFSARCAVGGATCLPLWTGVAGAPLVNAPTPGAKSVFVGASDGHLYAFPKTCVLRCLPSWTASAGGAIAGSPVVNGSTVFVTSTDGNLYAFPTTCASICNPKWIGRTSGPVRSGPAVGGNTAYVTSNDGRLYAFPTTCGTGGLTCAPRWTASVAVALDAAPAVTLDTVYVTTGSRLYLFRTACGATTCSALGSYPLASTSVGSATVAGGLVYVTATNGRVTAYDAQCRQSCSALWNRAFPSAPVGPAAVADGRLFVLDASGLTALWTPPRTWYASTTGADSNAGTIAAPLRSIGPLLGRLVPGDTLYARGGVYTERITTTQVHPGRASLPITVAAFPGERPVIQGLLWLKNADYWHIDGIGVTWSAANRPTDHMVKLTNGVGWTLSGAELSGAHSFAALLVAGDVYGEPSGWEIRETCAHDTVATNDTNQDQLLYVNTGTHAGAGLVSHNLLFNATNGSGVKIAGPSATSGGGAHVTVSFNTIYNTAQGVLVGWTSHDNRVKSNIIDKTGAGFGAIRGYQLRGTNNSATGNIAFATTAMFINDSGYQPVADLGANSFPVDPKFDSVAGCSGFNPQNPAVQGLGR